MNDHTDTLRKPHARAPLADLPDLWRHDAKHYSDEAEAAVGLACADELDAAIAALEAGRSGEAVAEFVRKLHAFADNEYCRGIHVCQEPECLGWEAKAAAGKYGGAEHDAHRRANKHFGAHFGIYAAIRAAQVEKPAAAPQQPPPVGVTDAVRRIVAEMESWGEPARGAHIERVIAELRALSHQQPAPSVSEADKVAWDAITYGTGYMLDGKRVSPDRVQIATAPVSEPAASKSRTKRIAIEQGRQDPFVPIPGEIGSKLVDADSGEGLPELPPPQRECWVGHTLFTAEQMRAYAIEARRLTTTGDDNEHARLYEQLRDEIPATTHGAAIAWIRERTTGQGDVERLPPEPGSDGVPPLPEPDVRYTGPQTFLSHGETRWAYSGEAMLAFRDDGIAYGRRLAARSEGGAS